ncbi:sugar-binding transcriptional regulator [Clostridium sp. CM028]|uniref:sugar-binding transcriptional regulator n=1 Tax=unclassified Clostridium TaxID=2614128 RepID=UPI001C0AB09F|nr:MULTISPECIES: sugar-binding domain-containing protein [unclassified Clostridium]MBU3090818.1 sugar-binding transcriptional regulator [Clostridium sp. CF011]MBW9144617.1 sugar-binding transcriptional regulator [Clostridium sp. CM027]MBW9147857.1 sugar-binding transcriptional regulator [Clostridium sp. CM028]UVE40625.1 sugar-binding transcriptional regulator [Clostridium sp. CM027]WAG69591.1 sugar-binding transcriptional regulator [Clostridium sp. CF011]
MESILKLQQKIVPELIELLEKRHDILRMICYNQPIGRRILADQMCISERIVRNEINFLKSQNLIEVNALGMFITTDGEEILDQLKGFIHEIKGLSKIEKFIEKHLKLQQVIVVPGNVEIDKSVLKEVGKVAAIYVMDIIKDNSIIAITGGSTVKEVVDNLSKNNKYTNVLVLPARGGMARNVEIQANTLVARLADKIGGNYELLHVPDNLSNDALKTIVNEKSIKSIIDKIRSADILIYGIGIASDMAMKREVPEKEIKELEELGAVGEAFGQYYNELGEIVHSTPTIGVKNEDVTDSKTLIAVAAGKNKARAIIATEINRLSTVLIIDQAAAEEIVNIIEKRE